MRRQIAVNRMAGFGAPGIGGLLESARKRGELRNTKTVTEARKILDSGDGEALVLSIARAEEERYEAVAGDMTFDFRKSNGRVQANMVAATPGHKYKYFNDYRIRNAPWFTFLWDTTFKIGFAPEYFLPAPARKHVLRRGVPDARRGEGRSSRPRRS